MFTRRKRNKSGTYSVQVISKFDGRYKLEMSFGSSSDEKTLKDLEYRASEWISQYGGQTVTDFSDSGCNEDFRLKLYKELERVIQMMNLGISVDAVIDIAKTVPTLVLELPDGQMITRTIFNTRDQQLIRPHFPNLNCTPKVRHKTFGVHYV